MQFDAVGMKEFRNVFKNRLYTIPIIYCMSVEQRYSNLSNTAAAMEEVNSLLLYKNI